MSELEQILTPVPGPRSRELARRLRAVESRGVTFLGDDFPVFWERADGATITDADGNRFLDLTSAFGVALTGHANSRVADAIAGQAALLAHGMGDVHPTELKTRLLERLAELAPLPDARGFLCSSGAEAVEFALKTALLATGRPNALAFEGSYHGLAYGALEVTGIARFRAPFSAQLRNANAFVAYPASDEDGDAALEAVDAGLHADPSIGAVIVEPIQGRAGVVVPPDGFLAGLRMLCDTHGALLIVDEILTGFGRTGAMFAVEREAVVPDLLCLGKALAGGFPLSAVVGMAGVMDAWPPSAGEALHTSTYLGNPMGCAAALANIEEIERIDVPGRARRAGERIAARLGPLCESGAIAGLRGRGALWGVVLSSGDAARAAAVRALQAGVIVLQSGIEGEVLTVAPPATIADEQLDRALDLLGAALEAR
jgi:4-aminobutyrate aminotransferase-like enzyme